MTAEKTEAVTGAGNAQRVQFWIQSDSVADSTIDEVVAKYGGKVLRHTYNGNHKVELTQTTADEIANRYGWLFL